MFHFFPHFFFYYFFFAIIIFYKFYKNLINNKIMSKNDTLDLNIIQDSMELDTDIYIKLSGILINEVINNIPDSVPPSFKLSEIFKNFHNDSTAEGDVINNENNKKLGVLIKLFDTVNKERISLREILIKLIKKKFWKLKLDKKNSNFYMNKFKGINIEVLKNRLENLEKKIKQKDIKLFQNDKVLKEMKDKNNLHLRTIKNQTNYLKDSILNGSIISGDIINMNNSINMNKSININNFNSNVEVVNPNKCKRKIRRRNSTSNYHEIKIEKEIPKKSRFKNEKTKRKVRKVNKCSFNLQKKKEEVSQYNIYNSCSSSEDIHEEGVRNQIFKHQKTFR